MSVVIPAHIVDEIASVASDHAQEDVRATATYSGRGMYGDRCLGFEGSFSGVALGLAIAEVLAEHEDELDGRIEASDFARSSQDSMGLGTIIYFPRVTVDGDLDEDEEDEY